MADLRDSQLTAAQLNVLVELNSTGKLPKGVRPRTIEILREGKFIDVTRFGEEDTTYVLRTEGKREIGVEVEDSFHQKLMADVAELESGLQADTFDNSLPDAIKTNLGFAATLEWRNTKVWDGLTAEEIREDLDTRVPANRADKRAHDKAYRKAVKQLVAAL